jgi:malonyl-CoA O-methyltransferase
LNLKRFARLWSKSPDQPTLSSLDAYAQWADTYPPHAHNALMQTEERTMLDLFLDVTGKAALDLACGTGRYGRIALERGAKTVIGLDNSAAMLRANILKQRALSTTEAIPLASESVDVVLCGLALGHLPRLAPSLSEMGRILKPGGWALVSDFHPFLFLNGQRRTFAAPDGKTYAVEHYPHLYADYHQNARQAGLIIDRIAEPKLTRDDKAAVPIVIVYRLLKSEG